MKNNTFRELEKKFVVKNIESIDLVDVLIPDCADVGSIICGKSLDRYWIAPIGSKADFIRLRTLETGEVELTAKSTDKGTTTDRIEINTTLSSEETIIPYLNLVHGEIACTIEKEYTVFFSSKYEGLNISTYQVTNDARIFLEVEGQSIEAIDAVVKRLGLALELEQQELSLFDLVNLPAVVVIPEGVNINDIMKASQRPFQSNIPDDLKRSPFLPKKKSLIKRFLNKKGKAVA